MDEESFEEIQLEFDENASDVLGYKVPTCAPSDLDSFQHEPIPGSGWIRLLTVKHDVSDMSDRIAIELRAYELEQAPQYFTLSYTWGRPAEHFPMSWDTDDSCRSIVVNGKAFDVRPNLFHALACLRNHWQGQVTIWIDAICINQKDLIERESQIQQMGKIYSGTIVTLAWLGPPDCTSADAIHKAKAIAASWKSKTTELRTPHLVDSNPQAYADCVSADFANENDVKLWHYISYLLSRFWWERGWVAQEVGLSPRTMLFSGPWIIDWTLVAIVLRAVEQHLRCLHKLPNPASRRLMLTLRGLDRCLQGCRRFLEAHAYYEQRTKAGYSPEMLVVLAILRSRQTTDAKDKVFAGLGLITSSVVIKPDYSRSVQSIYLDAARHCITSANKLEILGCCQYPTRVKDLPSWCPDWSDSSVQRAPFTWRPMRPDGGTLPPLWSAGGPPEDLEITLSDTRGALTLKGCVTDALGFVARSHLAKKGWVPRLTSEHQALHEWATKCASAYRQHGSIMTDDWAYDPTANSDQFEKLHYGPTGENLKEAYARTLCADVLIERNGLMVARVRDWAEKYPKITAYPEWQNSSAYVLQKYRTVGFTVGGCLALVPMEAEPGDVIAIIRGNPVPLVLRRHHPRTVDTYDYALVRGRSILLVLPRCRSGDAETYRLVGECYLHGVMDGELYDYLKLNDMYKDITIL